MRKVFSERLDFIFDTMFNVAVNVTIVMISWLQVALVVSHVILRITCNEKVLNKAMEVEAYGVCFLSYS